MSASSSGERRDPGDRHRRWPRRRPSRSSASCPRPRLGWGWCSRCQGQVGQRDRHATVTTRRSNRSVPSGATVSSTVRHAGPDPRPSAPYQGSGLRGLRDHHQLNVPQPISWTTSARWQRGQPAAEQPAQQHQWPGAGHRARHGDRPTWRADQGADHGGHDRPRDAELAGPGGLQHGEHAGETEQAHPRLAQKAPWSSSPRCAWHRPVQPDRPRCRRRSERSSTGSQTYRPGSPPLLRPCSLMNHADHRGHRATGHIPRGEVVAAAGRTGTGQARSEQLPHESAGPPWPRPITMLERLTSARFSGDPRRKLAGVDHRPPVGASVNPGRWSGCPSAPRSARRSWGGRACKSSGRAAWCPGSPSHTAAGR